LYPSIDNQFFPGNKWSLGSLASAILLIAAAAATLTVFVASPRVAWICEIGLLFAGLLWGWRSCTPSAFQTGLLLAIAAWGFLQLAAGLATDHWAAWDASIRVASLAAAALAARECFGEPQRRNLFLRAFAWFGFAIAVLGVLAYYLSPGRILWLVSSPYPQTWGPFLSRNNFAQFLELVLPVALWLGLTEHDFKEPYLWMSAVILAAGLASASRAGALLMVVEAAAVWASRGCS
jgi:hypothetical protein